MTTFLCVLFYDICYTFGTPCISFVKMPAISVRWDSLRFGVAVVLVHLSISSSIHLLVCPWAFNSLVEKPWFVCVLVMTQIQLSNGSKCMPHVSRTSAQGATIESPSSDSAITTR
ncbi:unnamed protein product [Owenia fusiformis]|uniref:Uncharacterized protein n=1 Tax=Owenia fusiformis TaxID=6347 RepID=A0A8S4NQK1_OWEFU|nr:unnamed protein product [Owenia fusiformis]